MIIPTLLDIAVEAGLMKNQTSKSAVSKIPPWHVRRRGKKWLVIGTENDKVYGTHDSEKQALAHMRALYANVPDVQKGDEPGHPFRGNQWTSGSGGGSDLKFKDSVTAAYSGQVNGTLRALDKDGNEVGHLDWVKYGDDISISMVESKRIGAGAQLVERLLDDNPDARLRWGMTTPAGEALRARLEQTIPRLREQNERETQERSASSARYSADLTEYQQLRDSLKPGLSRTEVERIGSRLTELDDKYGGDIEQSPFATRKSQEGQPDDPAPNTQDALTQEEK